MNPLHEKIQFQNILGECAAQAQMKTAEYAALMFYYGKLMDVKNENKPKDLLKEYLSKCK